MHLATSSRVCTTRITGLFDIYATWCQVGRLQVLGKGWGQIQWSAIEFKEEWKRRGGGREARSNSRACAIWAATWRRANHISFCMASPYNAFVYARWPECCVESDRPGPNVINFENKGTYRPQNNELLITNKRRRVIDTTYKQMACSSWSTVNQHKTFVTMLLHFHSSHSESSRDVKWWQAENEIKIPCKSWSACKTLPA